MSLSSWKRAALEFGIWLLHPLRNRIHPTETRNGRVVSVTEAELLATPARAWLIRPAFIVFGRGQRHPIGRGPALLEQFSHCPHLRARVSEEQLQARTEVVLPRLTVARECESVLWTASVAKRPDVTILVLLGERLAAVFSKFALFGRGDELKHVRLMDVAHPLLVVQIQRLFGQEEAILTVNIACCTARLRHHVEARRRIDCQSVVGQRRHFLSVHFDH
jgi:hypothetical protein